MTPESSSSGELQVGLAREPPWANQQATGQGCLELQAQPVCPEAPGEDRPGVSGLSAC